MLNQLLRRTTIKERNYVRINHNIQVKYVRLVMNGEQLGVVPTHEAQRKADELGLDLVEIVPNAEPHVCEIMDYGKYKFDKNKKKKEDRKKNKEIEMKEVRLRPVTSEHDLKHKINDIKKFIEEGRVVQVFVWFKNRRELAFKDQAYKIIGAVAEAVKEVAVSDRPPVFNEKRLTIRLMPQKK